MSDAPPASPVRSFSATLRAIDPTFILAGVGTAAYYGVVLQPAFHGTTLAKYTTEHPVEYAIVALFIWGCIDLLFKLSALPREMWANKQDWLPVRNGREPVANARPLLDGVRGKSAWLRGSRIGQRIESALAYVTEGGAMEDFSEHVRYLADQDFNRAHGRYSLLRFAIAVTPILGFLGTVVHFGAAIGSFSFTNMDAQLPTIVAGMGTAFNTTTVALGSAMTLMFGMFLCERMEYAVLAAADRQVESQLVNRFEVKDVNVIPFLATIEAANREALDALRKMQEAHTAVLAEAVAKVIAQIDERQEREIARWQASLDEQRQRQTAFEKDREAQLRQIVTLLDARESRHMDQVQLALQQATGFSDNVRELVRSINGIAAGEGKLVELQTTLSDNLRVIHETHQIDSALHGLSAAIHLLTARNQKLGVHDPAA